MKKVSHTTRLRPTVEQLVQRHARRLRRADLHYGHGTENAWDEAALLACHALGKPRFTTAADWRRSVSLRSELALAALVERRVRERIPAVYLTNRTVFAGLSFHVDERVLVPRSPLAELVEQRFAPWIDPRRVKRVLDLGTGSGCIAIACARAFPSACVDAVDISVDALEVARLNIRSHRLRRVEALQSDYFAALAGRRYDIIVANPPYVGEVELASLPLEYWHEPRVALAAGRDGLDAVHVILRDASAHLEPHGILVVEVGNTEALVRRQYPRLPMVWLQFERGGGGVFLVTAAELATRRS